MQDFTGVPAVADLAAMRNALKSKGHKVVHDLKDSDIDVILIVDPRRRNPNVSFSTGSILRYLIFILLPLVTFLTLMICSKKILIREFFSQLQSTNDKDIFISKSFFYLKIILLFLLILEFFSLDF